MGVIPCVIGMNDYYQIIQDNRAPFWKKFFVALADVIGGAGGAVAGSATVVGGIAGGVTGAISSSVAFAKLWDIFAE